MPIEISVRSNIKAVTKGLSAFAYKQLPFATASALTALAKEVAADEENLIKATFKRPKPFTSKSLGVQAARKDRLEAKVYMKPIAEKYLAPYASGGRHVLPGRALLNPKNIRLDQYGQLPRGTLERLKARPDVFIGPVQTKSGIINGVWQRPYVRANTKVRGQSRRNGSLARGGNTTGKLKLLIRFGDAIDVTKRLPYQAKAKALIGKRFNAVFGAALAKAIATSR